jgi:folate-binding protein YgfZ
MGDSKGFYSYRLTADLLVTDEDAADFLQSQFSHDLRPFEAGRCRYGLWLNVKGKVIGDSLVLCEGPEQFRVLSERCAHESLVEHLERHIIADDVQLEVQVPRFVLELSAAAVEELGMVLPDLGQFISVESGACLICAREGLYQLVHDSEAESDVVVERLFSAGFYSLSEAEHGLLRIAAERPLVPDEVGLTDMPGEGGLDLDAVSFQKGCYLGQEVVARLHHVGKPRRGLYVVQSRGAVPSLPSQLCLSDAQPVGELRTAYDDDGNWTGVAMLKHRFVGIGDILQLEDREVRIVRLLRQGIKND